MVCSGLCCGFPSSHHLYHVAKKSVLILLVIVFISEEFPLKRSGFLPDVLRMYSSTFPILPTQSFLVFIVGIVYNQMWAVLLFGIVLK